ncbi:MAG: immunoglobulin-like domain-containing protein, partial [Treponema sp.]
EANATYAKFEKEVTVICKVKQEPKDLKLKKITVHGEEAKNDMFLIPLEHATVSRENIKVYFEEEDAPKEVKCEPASLNVTEVEQELKIYIEATSKYKKFERTIKIKHQEKKGLTLKTLTIHNLNAISGKVTIKEGAVIKANVALSFVDALAPSEFKLNPESLTLNHNEAKKLTISTEETARYKAFSIEVEVKREKEASAEKTIDDVVEALQGKLSWADSQVSENIELLNTVEGFTGSTVEWKSLNKKYCDDTGKIKKDIANIKVELEATVKWNGQEKKVKFITTIERIKKIREKESYGAETHVEEYNFEEENVLVLLKDDKPQARFELKNVDVENGQFEAQLKKKINIDGKLVDLEEWVNPHYERLINLVKKVFGATFIKLRKQTTITWNDYKGYLVENIASLSSQSTDEEVFNACKKLSFLKNFQGSWNEFKALSDTEKSKLIKEDFQLAKEFYAERSNISKDTSDEEFFKKLVEDFLSRSKFNRDRYIPVRIYKYQLEEENESERYLDNLNFRAHVDYDSSKEWYEQYGHYQCKSSIYTNIHAWTSNDANKLSIIVSIEMKEFLEEKGVPISNTFTLKGRKDGKELHCTISNVHDGELTLSTTGAVTGTYEMRFEGDGIHNFFN